MRLIRPLAIALVLAGCGSGGSDRTATLRADVVGDLSDPSSPPRLALTASTQLGLVQFDDKGQVVPGLAASWRVVDQGRSLIFRLRDAKWSDGRVLKAGDVVQVFRRIVAPSSNNPLKALFAGIDNAPAVMTGQAPASLLGVNAPLDDVVEVRLSTPDAGMLALLALPQAAIVRGESRPPAIGAFTLPDPGTRPLGLVRNTRYFDAADTRLGKVVLTAAPDATNAVARFLRGDTDLVIGDGIAGLVQARALAPRGSLRIEPTWGVYGYAANLRSGPLVDPRVRRALAMAIDRDALVRGVFNLPAVIPLVSLVPPDAGSGSAGDSGGAPVPDWASLDLGARRALAAQLLGAAGYGPANPLHLTISVPPGPEHLQVVAAAARDWAPLGVVATAVARSTAAQRVALARGDFTLALVERVAPAGQPLFFLRPLTCAGSGGAYCNPGADALIDSARGMADDDARAAAFAHAETAMLSDTPMIPLFVPVRWALVGRGVSGWSDNQGGQHPFAALDKSR
ncbi:hypothetical protein KX816_03045 [Sphingosinicellaceae bacterium]|nr:hypothetical protein KX816_03045 [Sphingosinicellaceae bacterium]